MFCSLHTERKAIGACVSCGDPLCEECVAIRDGEEIMCRMCELLYAVIMLDSWGALPEEPPSGDDSTKDEGTGEDRNEKSPDR